MPESASGEVYLVPGGVCLLPVGLSSWGVSALMGVCLGGGGCLTLGCLTHGVSDPGGSDLGGMCMTWGLSAPRGCLPQTCPPMNRMTDRCKNITLATTSLRPVI